ncbi:MAG: SDR family oxidoreductase [Clostridiales bacterium]|nr:SDR family oxidoreductase [Clostridiales bacterium]
MICKHLAEVGAIVIIADLNEEAGNRIAGEISSNEGKADFVKLNVTDKENVKALFNEVETRYGSVNINVNCDGVTKRMDTLDFEVDAFRWIMDINVTGVFLCAQTAACHMVKQGGGGKIVNIASVGGLVGLKGSLGYACSKGAVVQMIRTMALDLAEYGINVNGVAPALNRTAIAAPVINDPVTYQSFMDKIPLKRLCDPMDVACAIQFLCSSASDFITGQILPVDGGWTVE